MDNIGKDLRFVLRTLRKQPAFTATVVATLGLAIGASTAIFSIVDSTLLRPLPFRAPGQLVVLNGVAGPERAVRGGSFIEVQDWGRLNRTLESVAIYDETSLNMRTAAGADRVEAEMVSASYFPMIGATPQIGRLFTATEDLVPNAHPVVVISDALWTSRFARDTAILGRSIDLNERPFTVLGVMKPGFRGIAFDTDVWFPAAMAQANGAGDLGNRGSRWLGALARVKPGMTIETVQADLERVGLQLARDFPQSNTDRSVDVVPLRDSYLGTTRTLIFALFTAVGFLLLIACANVIGLQLVRASGRRREFALRIAIGADRVRLVQQLVVEGVVLALLSAAVGSLVALWGLQALIALTPEGLLPLYATPAINLTAFGFAFLMAVGCGVIFGLVPALRSTGVSLTDSLKEGARGSAGGFGRGMRLGSQQILVISEAAVAIVLLIGAGLYVRSLQRQLDVPTGFDADGVLRARMSFPAGSTPESRLAIIQQMEQRLGAIPSVSGVAIGSDVPLGAGNSASFIHVPGQKGNVRYYRHFVTPGFFRALDIDIVAGRGFTAEDRVGTESVAIVNQSTARRYWPGANAVGRKIRLGSETAPEATIVGVAADVRYRDLTTALDSSEPDVYFPIAQRTPGTIQFAVRSSLSGEAITGAVRREMAAIDRNIPLFAVRGLDELVQAQTASSRFASTILTVFGGAALLLTAIGLYGVLAFLVTLRKRELGIRLALGATEKRVLGSVVGQGLRLVLAGAVIGAVLAAYLTRMIASQLFGVGAHDPIVFVVVPIVLLVVAGVASWVPARRASRVNPQIALRSE